MEFEAGPFTVLFGKNNAGKTSILEGLYEAFQPSDKRAVRRRMYVPGHPQYGYAAPPRCDLYVELEQGVPFDDEVCAAVGEKTTTPPPRYVAFNEDGLFPGGPLGYRDQYGWPSREHPGREHTIAGPLPHVLFLDWDVEDLNTRVEDAIADLATYDSVGMRAAGIAPDWPWLQRIELKRRSVVEIKGARTELERDSVVWRVSPAVQRKLDQLNSLATDLLPDFVHEPISVQVLEPRRWGVSTKVGLYYGDYPRSVEVDAAGHAAARWAAASLQLALHLMAEYPDITRLEDLGVRGFSGHILLIDEPEAHLHPSGAASIVRWCQRMVVHGFTIVAASHHEEFLRAPTDEVTLVHVTRPSVDGDVYTKARTLDSSMTIHLQQLAADVGMHPAHVLALRRAILFVEGPLDEAVLDEYGGLELDAAGVKVIPIHGTKNLEGLVSAELATQLGIKIGVLTDATDPTTISQRSRRKWSSEERKVVRLIEMAKERGLPPPMMFGVPEADLLFALPVDAIREYLQGPFPGWKELLAECREALGKGPSDSVDWKSYALERYRLPITTAGGVRDIVRTLDLNKVPLTSIRRVIGEVVNWAK